MFVRVCVRVFAYVIVSACVCVCMCFVFRGVLRVVAGVVVSFLRGCVCSRSCLFVC